MHIEKYNRTAVGHMIEHYERNPRIYKTQKHINPELTKLNYTLGNDELKGMAKYKKILETPGLKVMNRADVNTIIEFNLDEDGQENPDLWLVKSISTDFGVDGTQTINAMRYYPLYADIIQYAERVALDVRTRRY